MRDSARYSKPKPRARQTRRTRTSSRRTTPGNAAMAAVADAAALYGVRAYRMQSRTFTVKGAGGRDRPMFMGGWTDRLGVHHTKGMADFLLTPKIKIATGLRICVALWVEVKAGRDSLSADQVAFRDDVIDAGACWICAQDSCEELIAWFQKHGVER
jgi:hypothetical protein